MRANSLRFVLALTRTNLGAAYAQRRAFWLQAIFMLLNNVTFFAFWWILFERFERIGDWRLGHMLVLFGNSASAFGIAVVLCGGLRELSRMINDGDLDAYLTQPQPALVQALGSRTLSSGWGDIVSGLILIAISGEVELVHVPFVIVGILCAAVVFTASGVIFHSLAFWLGRSESLSRQLWEFLVTFSIQPEPLFGGALRLLLYTALPAGLAGYVPAALMREPSIEKLAAAVTGAAAVLALALFVFERGLRRYESGNRIGLRI
jgi:ABC-2 type transport system permease protein